MSSPPRGSLTLRVRLRRIYLDSAPGVSVLRPGVRWMHFVSPALSEPSSGAPQDDSVHLANRPARRTPSVLQEHPPDCAWRFRGC